MAEAHEEELVQEGVLPPEDFHAAIERIREIADYDLVLEAGLHERLNSISERLLVSSELVQAAAAALLVGHLVLQGPPGTGKSSLARALIHAFHCSAMPVTAHEEWSAFEVIGRQELRAGPDKTEAIVPVNGFFTEAVVQCAGAIVKHFDDPAQPQATWLLVDELNRAHLDRAFGELFTVLGTDDLVPILLPHQHDGNRELVTPRRFRIVATLNSVDKQFVNSLGQGLKRRFTFLTLDIPPRRAAGEPWGNEANGASMASREFNVVLRAASARLRRRALTGDGANSDEADGQIDELLESSRPTCERLFELAEDVRYAAEDSDTPYLPIGTAQLIDTVEVAASRLLLGGTDNQSVDRAFDWAAAVKLGPLFDTDLRPDLLKAFAEALPEPFDTELRRELLQIVSAGLYYVG